MQHEKYISHIRFSQKRIEKLMFYSAGFYGVNIYYIYDNGSKKYKLLWKAILLNCCVDLWMFNTMAHCHHLRLSTNFMTTYSMQAVAILSPNVASA